mmetsp:Transcript_62402/g.114661  ORF Transcript_62402/g.114661 Transcript_62402/m.114661 type:complete len:630 (+) Transcript_62402:62-1951(+)
MQMDSFSGSKTAASEVATAGRGLDLDMYSENKESSAGSKSTTKYGASSVIRRLPANVGPRESDMGRAAMPNNGEDNDRPLGQIDGDLELLSEIPMDLSSPRSTFNGRRSGTQTMRSSFNSTINGRSSNQISYQRVSFKRLTANSLADDYLREDSLISPRGTTRGQTSTEEGPTTTGSHWASSGRTATSSSGSCTVVAGAASLLRNLEAHGGLSDTGLFADDSMLSELPQDMYSTKHVTTGSPSSSSPKFWNSSLQGPGAGAGSLMSKVEERRIDPELGNHAVTFDEMCQGLRAQQLTLNQLHAHWANLKPQVHDTFDKFSTPIGQHLAPDTSSASCSSKMHFSLHQRTDAPRSGWEDGDDWHFAGLSLSSTRVPSQDSSLLEANFPPHGMSACQQQTLSGDLAAISENAYNEGSITDTLDSKHLEAYITSCSSKQCTIMSDIDLMAGAAVDEGSSRVDTLEASSWEAYLSACSSKPCTLTSDIDIMADRAMGEEFMTARSEACFSRQMTYTSDLDEIAQNALCEGGPNWAPEPEPWEALDLMSDKEHHRRDPSRRLSGSKPVPDFRRFYSEPPALEDEWQHQRQLQDGESFDTPDSLTPPGVSPKTPVAPAFSAPERARPNLIKARPRT